MITLVAAAGRDNALGKKGDLLWHLPDDFKHFKNVTLNHPIIMGRKTFDTFPKLLPKRTHIIITRQKDYKADGCSVVHSLGDALKKAEQAQGHGKICVIGGGQIYKLALPYADKIELTRIHAKFEEADTFFPAFDESEWKLTYKEFHPTDEKHKYAFTYLTYQRK